METSPVTLARLFPDQLTDEWKALLLPAVEVGLGHDASNPKAMEGAYLSLRMGVLRAYVLSTKAGNAKSALGVLLVGRHTDTMTGVNTLHIWSLFANANLTLDQWHQVYPGLRRAALELNCSSITAQTNNPRVVEIVQALGGTAEATLLRLEV